MWWAIYAATVILSIWLSLTMIWFMDDRLKVKDIVIVGFHGIIPILNIAMTIIIAVTIFNCSSLADKVVFTRKRK